MSKNELIHYGVLGMKWGVRRYQNPDGSLTPAGKRRLAKEQTKLNKLTLDQLSREQTYQIQEKHKRMQGPEKYGKFLISRSAKIQRKNIDKGRVKLQETLNKLNKKYDMIYDPISESVILREKITLPEDLSKQKATS